LASPIITDKNGLTRDTLFPQILKDINGLICKKDSVAAHRTTPLVSDYI